MSEKKTYTIRTRIMVKMNKEFYIDANSKAEAKKIFQEAKNNDTLYDGYIDFGGDDYGNYDEGQPVIESINEYDVAQNLKVRN